MRWVWAAAAGLWAGCAASDYEAMSRLERQVRHAVARHAPEAAVSVWLAQANGGELLAVRADDPVAGASTLKILLLVEGHARALEGTFRWSDSVTLLQDDLVGGSGSLQHERPGSSWSYAQLAARMISESDNVAANILLRRLGMRAVNERARALGLRVTRFERAFMDFDARDRERKENWTTAREMGELCRAIFRREILTPEACDDMVALLERTARGRIAAGVPRDLAVGHKSGSGPGLRHDVGWVRVPGHPYVLSVFLDNVLERRTPDDDRGVAALEAVARAVFAALGPSDE